jgi:copper(I)-binding protein
MTANRRLASRLPLALITLALAVAACSTGTASPAASAGAGSMTVQDAWARPAAMGGTSAAYFVVSNGTGTEDALIDVSTPAAGSASLHETMAADSGMTGMQPVAEIPIPAGGSATLGPGGYHVMLMDLPAPLEIGATLELTLTFRNAEPVTVRATVKAG